MKATSTPWQYAHPVSHAPLRETEVGLVDEMGVVVYPREKGVLRTVPKENYAESFGFQWNLFRTTQIDREQAGAANSRIRFFGETGWEEGGLSGETVLEVGAGAGRFTEVILAHTQATLASVDYSTAVDANYKTNGANPRLTLLQASVYEMPFAPQQFDKVLCLGVLQHTPDFRKSIEALCAMVKPGGELVVDFYPILHAFSKFNAKYLLRPWTKRMPHEKLLKRIDRNLGWLIPTYRFFSRLGLNKVVNRFLPICDIDRTIPKGLSEQQLREWVLLDTFDMFSPEHDHPQRIATVKKWVESAGLTVTLAEMVTYAPGASAPVVKARRG